MGGKTPRALGGYRQQPVYHQSPRASDLKNLRLQAEPTSPQSSGRVRPQTPRENRSLRRAILDVHERRRPKPRAVFRNGREDSTRARRL
uniref:Uncharacterized protein n=1 Tax=Rhipicephalus zambeziensis TaxID=60191 RepID=A0A224YEC3_9ACAR